MTSPTCRIWTLSFFVALLVYGSTADYGPQWQDSGWQQWRIVTGDISHPTGLVVTHPLQFWLARLALHLPWLEPAGRTTIVSVAFGAIAIANLAAFGWVVTRRSSAALIPAAAMMLSHTFWQHSTHTESYALVAALLTTEWLCLAQLLCAGGGAGWLIAAAAANGLGVANHLLAGLGTPILVAVFVYWTARGGRETAERVSSPTADAGGRRYRRHVAGYMFLAVLVWLICTLPYSGLVVVMAMSSHDWGATLHSAFFGDYEQRVLNTELSSRMLRLTAGFLLYNLPGLTIPLALHALVRKTAAPVVLLRTLAAYLAIHAIFAIRYAITDQYTFLFPIYFCMSALAAIGLADVQARWAAGGAPGARLARLITLVAAFTALWPPAVYEIAYRVFAGRGTLDSLISAKPYRDGYAALLLPWGDRSGYVRRANAEAFALAQSNGVVLVGDTMVEHALRYHQRMTPGTEAVALEYLNIVGDHDAWPELKARLRGCLAEGRAVVLVPRERDRAVLGPLKATWVRRGDLYVLSSLDE